MSDELTLAAIGGAAAITGGLLTGFFDWANRWRARPKLELRFENENDAFMVEGRYNTENGERTSKHVRVCLVNSGRSIARDCRVYLTEIVEFNQTQTHSTKLYDAKELPWAGFPKDYNPRNIPTGIKSFVDIVRISEGDPDWNFQVASLFASQKSLRKYKGTYRITLVAAADNARPTSIKIDVSYLGDYSTLRSFQVK